MLAKLTWRGISLKINGFWNEITMRRIRIVRILTLIVVSILLSACAKVESAAATPTPAALTSSATIVATAVTNPTPDATLTASLVYPGLERITPQNVKYLATIDYLGEGNVTAIAVSPDKQTIALSTPKSGVILYDSQTLDEKQKIDVHGNAITFSPDGKTLLVANGQEIMFYDLASGKLIKYFSSQIADWEVTHLEFSPDGGRIIITTDSKSPYSSCDVNGLNFAVYNLDASLIFDRYICAGPIDGGYYRLTPDGKIYFFRRNLEMNPEFYDWSSINLDNGAIIESVKYDFIDPKSNDLNQFFYDIDPQGKVFAREEDQNGKTNTALVDVKTRKVIQNVDGLIRFLPAVDGKLIWKNNYGTDEVVNNKCGITNPQSGYPYRELFSNEDKALYSIADGSLQVARLELWNITDCKVEKRLSFPSAGQLVFSPDGRYLAGSNGLDTFVWDVRTRRLALTIPRKINSYISNVFTFSQNSKNLVISNQNNCSSDLTNLCYILEVWDVQAGKLLKTIEPAIQHIAAIHSTPVGNIVLVDDDEGIHFWNVETGKLLSTLPTGAFTFGQITGEIWIAPHNDNKYGQITLYDYQSGQQVRSFETDFPEISEIHLSKNQANLFVFSTGIGYPWTEFGVFDGTNGKTLNIYHWLKRQFQVSGDILANYKIHGDGNIDLWNIYQRQPYLSILGQWDNNIISASHSSGIPGLVYMDLMFSPDGKILVSNDRYSTRFWDTDNGTFVAIMESTTKEDLPTFSPDQYLTAESCIDGEICLGGVTQQEKN